MQHKNLSVKQSIGDRIRHQRRKQELTQRMLAQKVGLSAGAIGRMESERDYVTSRPTITALALILGCDPDWLETGKGGIFGDAKSPQAMRENDRKMKSFLGSLPDKIRRAISEASLASSHYIEMEYLLDRALKTRHPLPDKAEEEDFQGMLRRWGQKRMRGRDAIWRCIKVLEGITDKWLRDHVVDTLISEATRSDAAEGKDAPSS